MKNCFPFALMILFLITSCESEPKDLETFMVGVSEFNIQQDALADHSYVDVLGSSGNLTEEDQVDFYALVVVRSVETGDTINVLTTRFYKSNLNKQRTRFISNTTTTGKLIERSQFDEDLKGKNLNEIASKTFKKVLYDTDYITIDVRKYPTVTGILGDWHIESFNEGLKEK